MSPSDDRPTACLVALAGLPGVGPGTLNRCAREDGPVAAWVALVAGRGERIGAFRRIGDASGGGGLDTLAAAARAVDPDQELRRHRADGRLVLVPGDAAYPRALANDPAAPAVLFAVGDPSVLDAPTVAIVGTRSATRLGRDLAHDLGSDLAQHGVSVVSGLAQGIDGAAHQGALAGLDRRAEAADVIPGRPAAVIASGLDLVYPQRHRDLHRAVASAGVVVSETPLGRRPSRWRFPARNRIIAGLSLAVVVVESRSRGGSMLTAAEALDRGVPVLAVPGHPTTVTSAGTNDLLFDGATPVRDVGDVLDVIGVARQAVGALAVPAGDPRPEHGPVGRELLARLETGPALFADLVAVASAPLGDVAATLIELEADGWIARSGGWFEQRRPPVGARSGASGAAR